MKLAPLHRILSESAHLDPVLIHTGQHYDAAMSEVFFSDLSLSEPDVQLGVGPGSHAQQTARVMLELEPHLVALAPSAVIVVGDVNSTLGAAVCAAKLGIPVAHVEAGLRSFNREMPEEINRILTDALSDVLFAPSEDAVENLAREGLPSGSIHMVGNIMIDSLERMLPRVSSADILEQLSLRPRTYCLATLHRPSNVDDQRQLEETVSILTDVAQELPLVFVVHPRTMSSLKAGTGFRRLEDAGVRLLGPLGYLDFLGLESTAALVLTDSGGIQEETTVLGIPCLTLREETERPVTVTHGTNHVVGVDRDTVLSAVRATLAIADPAASRPPLWDGHTAERISRILELRYSS